MKHMVGVRCASLTLTRSHCPSGPAAGPAIPTSNSYSKKTQSSNAENKRPEEDRESGRKASSTAKVPASPLPGLERKKTTPTPSTVSHAPAPSWPAPPSFPGPHPAFLPWGLPSLGSSVLNQTRLSLAAYLTFPPGPLVLTVENPAPESQSNILSPPQLPPPLLMVEREEGSWICDHFGFL